ncbi:MAG: DNA gyrase/topoisomerase IV subunit B [Candidatus Micrarchaeia archaeon]
MDDNDYTAKDIIVLTGPQGVRKRPAMYIGSTSSSGFLHLLFEVIDNSVDEAMAGYGKNITIKLTREDNCDVAEVSDEGRGIPVDTIEKEGKPALEVIMTSLHSGAKFANKIYKISGGLHGVGLTVVNALSEYTEVTVKRGGKIYRQRFSRGMPVTSMSVEENPNPGETGTTIKFKPDMEIFSTDSFDSIALDERLRDISFLNPGIRIKLIDAREEEKTTEYYSEKGILDFLEYIRKGRKEVCPPLYVKKSVDTTTVEVAFQYIDSYNEELISFVNSIRTMEGGAHLTGFRSAITKSIVNYINNMKPQKNAKKINIEGEDTREGIIGIVSVMMQNPEFEGQTKEKLGNIQIKGIVENIVSNYFSTYLEEHPQDVSNIIEKVSRAAEARESARRARELVRKKDAFDNAVLPGKLADCTESDPAKTELFIVEGKSAAGSSKQGRDRFYQAILPLRGKVLNVEKANIEKIFNNAELHTLVTALGTGIKENFNYEKLRYGKVILLTDADVDGSHIRTLLLTFIYRYLRPLIEKGNVYVAQPPLYKIQKGKEVIYAYSDQELAELQKSFENGKVNIQRFKGLGEMNPEQLWETTMDPKTRILKQITIEDAEMAEKIFVVLMGQDVLPRKQFIEEHATDVSFLDI